MKIVTLLGSAKKKGNTATVLGWTEDELRALGHEVERVELANANISGCMGCAKCRKHPDEIACVQNDDANSILAKMIAADAVLFASPLYFWSFTAQMKLLIDRTYALVANYLQPNQISLMQDKRIGLIATGGSTYEDNAEAMFTTFDRLAGFLMAEKAGELYAQCQSHPSRVPANVEEKAKELARSLTA
ncbi:flavodoxin family protein [Oceanidesulfovibrio marinus]|uniref:Flavodoxin family protein n=1 Tax=Oceanidesulfovibrio marinus TaxID=370038 RepID=A0A6P1ZIK2_9BACT|nr:flavodoxin family protein [Oceanidesulfovibrio marinus]TVM35192.1 flavodoxin family protein [Oceanidesulfovibrio marinus]